MAALQVLKPHEKDLGGGFLVRRSLPSAARQAVGPFVFFDHFGPVTVRPEDNFDVRPHPHIGLATVTYLFEGAMQHSDSTGIRQRIEPGALNLMTAGRGIVHSERAPQDLRGTTYANHGLQLWLAAPADREEDAPGFQHVAADAIPARELEGGVRLRVLIGSAWGLDSPVRAISPTLYVHLDLPPGAEVTLPAVAAERALYSTDHGVEVDGVAVPAQTMGVLEPGSTPRLRAADGARLVMIGGEPLGHRFMVWNFVSSRKERILQAEDDWVAQRFAKVPGDEVEFIPLPGRA